MLNTRSLSQSAKNKLQFIEDIEKHAFCSKLMKVQRKSRKNKDNCFFEFLTNARHAARENQSELDFKTNVLTYLKDFVTNEKGRDLKSSGNDLIDLLQQKMMEVIQVPDSELETVSLREESELNCDEILKSKDSKSQVPRRDRGDFFAKLIEKLCPKKDSLPPSKGKKKRDPLAEKPSKKTDPNGSNKGSKGSKISTESAPRVTRAKTREEEVQEVEKPKGLKRRRTGIKRNKGMLGAQPRKVIKLENEKGKHQEKKENYPERKENNKGDRSIQMEEEKKDQNHQEKKENHQSEKRNLHEDSKRKQLEEKKNQDDEKKNPKEEKMTPPQEEKEKPQEQNRTLIVSTVARIKKKSLLGCLYKKLPLGKTEQEPQDKKNDSMRERGNKPKQIPIKINPKIKEQEQNGEKSPEFTVRTDLGVSGSHSPEYKTEKEEPIKKKKLKVKPLRKPRPAKKEEQIENQKGSQKSTLNKNQSKGLIMPDSGPLQLNSSYLLQLELDEQQAPEKPIRAGLRGLRGKIQVLEEEGQEEEEKKTPNKRGRKPTQNQEAKEHTERILQNEGNNVFVKKEIEEASLSEKRALVYNELSSLQPQSLVKNLEQSKSPYLAKTFDNKKYFLNIEHQEALKFIERSIMEHKEKVREGLLDPALKKKTLIKTCNI